MRNISKKRMYTFLCGLCRARYYEIIIFKIFTTLENAIEESRWMILMNNMKYKITNINLPVIMKNQ